MGSAAVKHKDPAAETRINECGYYVPIPTVYNLLDNAKFSVALLRVPPLPPNLNPAQGTISLYEIAKDIFGLITNNHMIPKTDIELICAAYINFEGFGRLILSHNDIVCVTTDKVLDATVIELAEQCVALLKQRGAKFLKIASARLADQVAMVQYPNGVYSFDKGIIHDIRGSVLHYYLGSNFGSSGSPILLWNFQDKQTDFTIKAIGLHKQRDGNNGNSISILGAIRFATHLPDIVNFHVVARIAPQM